MAPLLPRAGIAGGPFFVLFAILRCCGAMVTEGSIHVPGNSTVFVTKFCFTFDPAPLGSVGKLNVTLWAPSLTRHQSAHLVMFDDEAESFPGPSGQWDALSCAERMKHAKNKVRLDWTKKEAGQLIRFAVREHLRPRFWYIALADCSGSGFEEVKYKVHAINDAYGSALEFSTDTRLAPWAFLLLASAYATLVAAQVRAKKLLAESAQGDNARDKAAHPFARILIAGIVLGFVAAVLSCGHFFLYMVNGAGAPLVRVAAQLLCGASRFVLASLLLLLSEGKCVSYVMTAADARRMGRLLGPFFVVCLVLELWGDYSVSRRYTTDYVYTTPFGWAIILVNLLLLGKYASNLWQTHATERENSDGMFYRRWGLVYGTWFLALPTTAILSQAILAPYAWYIVSVCVNGAMTALVYAALVIGLWPGNKRTYLKLHPPLLPEEALEGCMRSLCCPESPTAQDFSPPARLPSLLGSGARGYRCAKLGYAAQP